jgi:hypothetical protein
LEEPRAYASRFSGRRDGARPGERAGEGAGRDGGARRQGLAAPEDAARLANRSCFTYALLSVANAIARRDARVVRRLESSPELAVAVFPAGATRESARDYFLEPIKHYVYAGDTLLHVAAAAYARVVAQALVAAGADVRARNRRGAEPKRSGRRPGQVQRQSLGRHAAPGLVVLAPYPDAEGTVARSRKTMLEGLPTPV